MKPSNSRYLQKDFLGAVAGIALLVVAFGYRWIWQDENRRAPLVANQTILPAMPLPVLGPVPSELNARSGPAPLPKLDLSSDAIPAKGVVSSAALASAKEAISLAEVALRKGQIFEPQNDNAMQYFAKAQSIAASDPSVHNAVQKFLTTQFQAAHDGLDRDNSKIAKALLLSLDEFDIDDRRQVDLALRFDRNVAVSETLAEAAQRVALDQIYTPLGASALDSYLRANQLDGRNLAARLGLEDSVRSMLKDALGAASRDDFENAIDRIELAKKIWPQAEKLAATESQILSLRNSYVDGLLARASAALDAQNAEGVEVLLQRALALNADTDRIKILRDRLSNAALYENLEPKQKFVDRFADRTGSAPEMVVIPIGQFIMGIADASKYASETPPHTVDMAHGVALSAREVTVREFRDFVNASAYKTDAELSDGSRFYDEKSGLLTLRKDIHWRQNYNGGDAREDEPVVHVSWNDAKAYVEWLRQRTGKDYRLPSESEFEYALKQGKQTKYPWGDSFPAKTVANLTGDRDRSPSGRTWRVAFRRYGDGYWGPAPVAKYKANSFGMFDLEGNVSEWVEDCWHENYLRAPTDGTAWVNAGCERRVVRGASWGSAPEEARSSARDSFAANTRSARVGFRVARDL